MQAADWGLMLQHEARGLNFNVPTSNLQARFNTNDSNRSRYLVFNFTFFITATSMSPSKARAGYEKPTRDELTRR